jgi:hypothetical protein
MKVKSRLKGLIALYGSMRWYSSQISDSHLDLSRLGGLDIENISMLFSASRVENVVFQSPPQIAGISLFRLSILRKSEKNSNSFVFGP